MTHATPETPAASTAPEAQPSLSTSHLVVVPSYNSGALLLPTVRAAAACWAPVWVVIDGSTDGSAEVLQAALPTMPGVQVLVRPRNEGKGAAVLFALEQAAAAGFTHALTMDADGQHPAGHIDAFMRKSMQHPDTMILGKPVFDADAPLLRVRGRRISNWWANLETVGDGIGDSLFGFRVYPIAPLIRIMQARPWMRRFDFDVEAVVRLSWAGIRPINVSAPVRYPRPEEGGISHFQYGRDNVLLTWMHTRLFFEFLLRLPVLLWRRLRRPAP